MSRLTNIALVVALVLAWSSRSSAQVTVGEPAPAPAPAAAPVAAPAAEPAAEPPPAPAATPTAAPAELSFAPPPKARGVNPNDPRPSTGVGLVVTGWIATGIGLLNFATLPLCSADFYPSDQEDLCVGMSIGIGSVGIALGVPLLIIGYNQRADYKEWKARNYGAAPTGLRLAVQSDGLLVSYGGTL